MIVEALLAVTLVSAFATFLAPDKVAGKLAFVLSLLPAAGSIWMYSAFDGSGNALLGGTLAFEETFKWVSFGQYALNWHVGLDGISMPLLLLTTILTPLAILSAWTPIQSRESQFYGLMLFTEVCLIGLFSALDFFVWFVFWELVLVPMYLLIGVWGGPRRKYAAIKFFVYTNVGSLLMFIGFIGLVFGLGDSIHSLSMPAIAQALNSGQLGSLGGIAPSTLKTLAFFAIFIGFGVKVAVIPLHTWLPDTYAEAPTPVVIMLSSLLLKMGTYALLRFNFTMLPDVAKQYAFIIALVAVVTVIYGALLALAQSDLKRIVAYSSISSTGYIVLGLVAFTMYGIGGATLQMVAHGLISGLMFMAVGVIYNKTGTRMVSDMSGLADEMPITVTLFVAGAFGYMGLPLMAGFTAEFFIFVGSFHSTVLAGTVAGTNGLALFTAVAMFGIVIVAGYLLFAMQQTLFGPFKLESGSEVSRASFHDVAPLVVLVLLIILLGVQPNILYQMIQDAVGKMALVTGGGF